MPIVTSEIFKDQNVGIAGVTVYFDAEGVGTQIVKRGAEDCIALVDEAVAAKARQMPKHFTVIEDHEIVADVPTVEPAPEEPAGVSVGDPQGFPAEDNGSDETVIDLAGDLQPEEIVEEIPDGVIALDDCTKADLLDITEQNEIVVNPRATKAEIKAAILDWAAQRDAE